MLQLIGFGPSPFARKARIALLEKNIPFILKEEVPWDSTAASTALHNPLNKVPILLVPTGEENVDEAGVSNDTAETHQGRFEAIYESSLIIEYLDLKFPHTAQLLSYSGDINAQILAKKIQVVADGVGSAMQLRYFELERDPAVRSDAWLTRQERKMDSGLAALQRWALLDPEPRDSHNMREAKVKEFLVGGQFGLADVAAGAIGSYIDRRVPEYDVKNRYPALWKYLQGLEQRRSFKESVPTDSDILDKIV